MEAISHSPDIIEVKGILSPQECCDFIKFSEDEQYRLATIETERGTKRIESVRNNDRVLYKNEALAEVLWSKIRPYSPQTLGNSVAVGLNELFRFYRYRRGQQFKPHRDESYIRNETEASYYTLLFYLNDGFKGGATKFNHISIMPEQGSALIFLHNLIHEGATITEGTKYVLRTDIMLG